MTIKPNNNPTMLLLSAGCWEEKKKQMAIRVRQSHCRQRAGVNEYAGSASFSAEDKASTMVVVAVVIVA
jgi:hypothetical protein